MTAEVPTTRTPARATGIARDLTSVPAAAGIARDHTARALASWNLPNLISDAELIVTELFTNAMQACSPAETVRLYLGRTTTTIVLAIWDASPKTPTCRTTRINPQSLDLTPRNFDANGGWGLPIVAALTTRQWIHPTTPRGKWVCAELPTR